MGELGEQMQLLYDRTAISASTLHELVAGFGDRVSADTRAAVAALTTTMEERVTGLAQLVRSDSEALRGEFARRTIALDEQFGRRLDEDLGHAIDQTLTAIDRNMIRMVDALDGHFDRLGAGVGDRAANAAELAIGARFDDVLARLHGSAEMVERGGAEARTEIAERFTIFDDRFTTLDERLTSFDERFTGTDQRFAALAKLVRSDSERIAEQILADQDVTKQALRAMKELQASLPVEVVQMVEERFASLAESIERSNEMLAGRIDRMAETIGQRQNDDIQVVIDRMGDAMHALASLGKGDASSDDPRIELG
jgi:DNA anti-recombination protein RmuC